MEKRVRNFDAYILKLLLNLFNTHPYLTIDITFNLSNQLKPEAIAAIYSKSLKLYAVGGSHKKQISLGKVVNLATNDAKRFISATLFLPYLFWVPMQALIVLVIRINMVGTVGE